MHNQHTRFFCPAVIVLIFLITISSAGAQQKKFTYNQVFLKGEPRLLAELPRLEGWLDDEHYLELQTNGDKSTSRLMKVNAATGKTTVYLDYGACNESLPHGLSMDQSITHSNDFSAFLFDYQNDLYYFSPQKNLFQRLTNSPSPEETPKFSPDETYVAFTRDHDLYVVHIETVDEKRLTHDGSDTILNGYASWVYYEEIFDRNYATFWWSPNSDMIAFLRFDDSPVPQFPLFDADGVHGKLEMQRYPKAGDSNPTVKLGIAYIRTGEIVWVETEDRVDHYLAYPFWTPDSKQLFFQWLNRGQDHLKIFSADPKTGRTREIYNEKQTAWIEFFSDLYFFKDGSGFLLRSDRDGWSHLYHFDRNGHLKNRITRGTWSVLDITRVDEEKKMIYFHGTQNSDNEKHLFRVNYDGKKLSQLTRTPGTHQCSVSPNASYFIDTFNNIHQPNNRELYRTNGKLLHNLSDSRLPITAEYELGCVELFTIPTDDDYHLPAIWVLPPDFDRTQKYPVIFRIYGGPGSHTVSNSFRPWSWHYLAQHGIIIISVDHRGSSHFGKQGTVLMHRQLGKWEMHNLISAVKWLRELPFVDENRIGIIGGSYGGYTTCMALTYGADYFTHGIAHFSVTDWRLYDSIYTERYMDTPEENPEGYRFGSVMTHAEKYSGYLLLTHGTLDDNVHLQNSVQLVDKLIHLNRNFELMIYPNCRHGFGPLQKDHATREEIQFWFRHFLNKELTTEECGSIGKNE